MTAAPTDPTAPVAVLPEPGDNVAIAAGAMAAGTTVGVAGTTVTLQHAVPEGHRFVVTPIAAGEPLLSWSTPFARAERDLAPGTYVCTEATLALLRERGVAGLPEAPSARNEPLDPYRLDETALRLGEQVAPVDRPGTFWGYHRPGRVAGTRNHVVVLGVTSRSAAFVTELARRLAADAPEDFDGVVPVAHTEAGEDHSPNNLRFLLNVLAGFLVHPNVGAVLVVDAPGDAVTSDDLRGFMTEHGYPEIAVPHAFFRRTGAFGADLAEATAIVEPWIPEVASKERTEQPIADLRVALQCGGSDAFSGITANPLAGAVGREVIRHGGAAVLAETDELIGAEGYVLENVRTADVARRFLRTVESFKERASWHGHTAEGNPSGGNVYRGLYNIVLKSVGAGRKRDRQLRLDHVVDYGEPLPGPGFTFMDSPGNDLESVAGQVATGCNLIFFTTGNGSITNFPFVPTLKFVTTTPRYELLHEEMDVDAGRYLGGVPMEQLTEETFDLAIKTASGRPTAGERAGHSQVSIWREWRQTEPREGVAISIDGRSTRPFEELPAADRDAELDGLPVPVPGDIPVPDLQADLRLFAVDGDRHAAEQVALVLPTSLCSGQIAARIADRATREDWASGSVDRAVALPHTEGCGVTGGAAEFTFARTMLGYLTHPNVRYGLLLEHGCEKTHNDYFRARLDERGLDADRFGWASIQRDGGIEATTGRVHDWFGSDATASAPQREPAGPGDLVIGLEARGRLRPDTAAALARLGTWVTAAGGTVVLSSAGSLLADPTFRRTAFGSDAKVAPTLAHGQQPAASGWHVMRMPTTDWMETVSGLGASGTQLVLVHVADGTVSGHRLVPVVRVSADPSTEDAYGGELDAVLRGDPDAQTHGLVALLADAASGRIVPRALADGDVGFQITRGLLGTSM